MGVLEQGGPAGGDPHPARRRRGAAAARGLRALLGRVKDEDALAALGAEAYMTSVLFDDAAYDVEPGFLAIPVGELADGGRAVLAALRAVAP
jgi:hypothetical protein